MNKLLPEAWDNMIAYPDFDVNVLNEHSLFWRVEASHSFFSLDYGSLKSESDQNLQNSDKTTSGLRINNYYHEPIAIRNGFWGSRLFFKKTKQYSIGLMYRSNIRLYMGLYRDSTNTPVKSWVLGPSDGLISWQNEFLLTDFLQENSFTHDPFYLKITIPDTCGEFIELKKLFLTEVCSSFSSSSSSSSNSSFSSNLTVTESVSQRTDLPDIAVGIVTFNRKSHLKSLLNQIYNINYPKDKITVFVVDNASSDGTYEMLEQEFSDVIVLGNKKNLGGSGGFNRFFKCLANIKNPPAFGWLIDDDAVIEKNTLLYLTRTITADKSIAIAGSVMMDLENPAMVYEAGGDLFKSKFGWKANIINSDVGNLGHVKEKSWEVGYAGAYSLLFRTSVIRSAGIWRDYFLHVDDSEWCLRVQKLTGQKVVIALDSLIWHVLQGAKKPFTFLRYYETRNFLDYFAGTGDKRVLLKVMFQTVLMGIKQLIIKRNDLFQFHKKGINDFIHAKFGKQDLKRSALILPDIQSIFDDYKKKHGKYPDKLFLVKEINSYMSDGYDYESSIIRTVRTMSPETKIIETSMDNGDSAVRAGDGFQTIKSPSMRIFLIIKMLKSIFFPSKGVVVIPFWNESIIPNNLAESTAVFENGKFSLYQTQRVKLLYELIKIFCDSFAWTMKIIKGHIDKKASYVDILPS